MRLDSTHDSHDYSLSLAASRPFDYHAWLATWQRQYVFLRIDARQCIDFVSPSVRDILGYEPGALLGRNYQEFFDLDHPLQTQLADLSYKLVGPGTADARRCVGRRADGQIAFFVLRQRKVVDAAGEFVGTELMVEDVTAQVDAELSLRQSERKYRRLVEGVAGDYVIFSLDARGAFTYAGPSAKEVFGRSAEELAGRDFRSLCPEVNARTPACGASKASIPTGRRSNAYLAYVVHPDDQQRTLEIQERPVFSFDGRLTSIEGIAKDVTEATAASARIRELTDDLERRVALRTEQLSRINEELRASERRYREVVETQTEFIVRCLPDGTRTFVNDAYCRFRNAPASDLLGTSFMPLIHPEEREAYARALAAATPSRPTVTSEIRALRPDGTYAYCQWTNRGFFDAEGRPVEFQSVGRDVTELRTSADLLRQKEAHLAHVSRLATLGEMVASIAHEIGQPLHAAKTFAEAARRHLQSGRSRGRDQAIECTAEISRAVTRTAEIIRRLREFTKSRPVKLERISLNTVVREAVEIMTYEIHRVGVVPQLDLDDALPPLEGDRIQLEQLCVNLIKNACEALERVPPGSRSLAVGTFRRGEVATLRVRDSGCGMDGANADRLFDAFYSTKEQGMGMGLSLCNSIAEAHRMKLKFHDNAGEPGLTFLLEFSAGGQPHE